MNNLSGLTSRVGAYISAVLDPKLRAEIDHYPGHRYLLYGKQMLLLHMSKEAFEFRAPWTYALIGSSLADHQPAEGRVLYEKIFLPAHDDKELLASVAVVKVYSNWGVKLPGFPKPNCREWTITCPFPLIFDAIGRTISDEQYRAQREKVVFETV